jgi:hypothetical protein
MKNECGYNEKINLFFSDELIQKEKEELFKHLETCTYCKQDFEIMNRMKIELSNLEQVELPKDFNSKLHQKLEHTVKNKGISKFEIYSKFINRFPATAAAVIAIAVFTGGYYMYESGMNSSKNMTQLAKGSVMRNEYKTENNAASNDLSRASFGAIEQNSKMSADTANSVINSTQDAKSLNSEQSKNINQLDGVGNSEISAKAKSTESAKAATPEDTNQSAPVTMMALRKEPDDVSKKAVTKDESAKEGTAMSFETIAKGYYSTHSDKGNYIVTNKDDFKKLWGETIDDITAMQEIDFSKVIVIAVFQGNKSTAGYSIGITSIKENIDNVEVSIEETEPSSNSMAAQKITSPYQIVKFKKVDKQVIFK